MEETRVRTTCLLILAAVAVGLALYLLSSVLLPFVLALFLAVALWPTIDYQVRRLRVWRSVALFNTLLVGAAILGLVGLLVYTSVSQMLEKEDVYEEKILDLLQDGERLLVNWRLLPEELAVDPESGGDGARPAASEGQQGGEEARSVNDPSVGEPGQSTAKATGSETEPAKGRLSTRLRQGLRDVLQATLSQLAALVSNVVVVLIFLMFLLMGRDPAEKHPGGFWFQVEAGIRGYLLIKVAVSTVTAILVGSVLMICGIDLALVFAVFTFLLNFIPNIGSIIAALMPLPVVLVSDVSTATKVIALGIPAAIQFTVGNVVEPRIMGGRLDLQPVVILLALIFWGTLWGMIGVFLAVPITAAIKILLEKAEATAPVAAWMAGRSGP